MQCAGTVCTVNSLICALGAQNAVLMHRLLHRPYGVYTVR